jgi:hypothetical protein
MEHGSSIRDGNLLDFFGHFPRESTRKWSEFTGKNLETFRPECYFHVPLISDVFLQQSVRTS